MFYLIRCGYQRHAGSSLAEISLEFELDGSLANGRGQLAGGMGVVIDHPPLYQTNCQQPFVYYLVHP